MPARNANPPADEPQTDQQPATPPASRRFSILQAPKRMHGAAPGSADGDYPIRWYWEAVARLEDGSKLTATAEDYGVTINPAKESVSTDECWKALQRALDKAGCKGPADAEYKTHDMDPSPINSRAYNAWLAAK